MTRFHAVSVTVLCTIIAAALATSCGGGAQQAVVTVAADRVWTDAGVTVEEGQTLSLDAEGTVWASPSVSYGPEGEPNRPDWKKYSVIPEAPHLGLIARIGEKGAPFFVGRSYQARATASGRLWLGVNDHDAANNKGEFKVTVSVK